MEYAGVGSAGPRIVPSLRLQPRICTWSERPEPTLGAVALILESVALYHMTPASQTSKEGERALAASSITAAKLGLLGSSVEMTGELLNRTKWGEMRLSSHVSDKNRFFGTRGLVIAFVGRLIGMVGGLISVYVDFNKGVDAFKRGQRGVGRIFLCLCNCRLLLQCCIW